RIEFMMKDAAPSLVLDDPQWLAALAEYRSSAPTDADRVRPLSVADPAYVIYTSGSTGAPKGVVVPHRGVVNRLLWGQAEAGLQISPGERVMQKTPIGFDISVWELFWPLVVGGSLVLARPGGHRDVSYLAALIRECEISVVHFVPSMLAVFVQEATDEDLHGLAEAASGAIPGRRLRV